MQRVAKGLGGQWKEVGTVLKLQDATIDQISTEEESTSRKGFKMLLRWSQKTKKDGVDKVAELINAFRECDRQDLIKRLKKIDPVATVQASGICGIL